MVSKSRLPAKSIASSAELGLIYLIAINDLRIDVQQSNKKKIRFKTNLENL